MTNNKYRKFKFCCKSTTTVNGMKFCSSSSCSVKISLFLIKTYYPRLKKIFSAKPCDIKVLYKNDVVKTRVVSLNGSQFCGVYVKRAVTRASRKTGYSIPEFWWPQIISPGSHRTTEYIFHELEVQLNSSQ